MSKSLFSWKPHSLFFQAPGLSRGPLSPPRWPFSGAWACHLGPYHLTDPITSPGSASAHILPHLLNLSLSETRGVVRQLAQWGGGRSQCCRPIEMPDLTTISSRGNFFSP